MRLRDLLSLGAAVVLASSVAVVLPASPARAAAPDLGPNVLVFDPTMSTASIQAAVDAVATQQVDNEFGTQRYALLFKPGTYGSDTPLTFQVGYYTEVAGLGASPTDVVINGHVDVYNRCFAPDNCIALDNFWRSVSNLTINVAGLADCRSSGNFWAVSQAAPMRRVKVTGGNLTLMDYCTAGPQYASGGFIADSQTGFIINGSQQQFLVRNSSIGGWSNGVWNQVFAGVDGAPAQSFGATPYNPPPYTTLATTPLTRERPLLYVDDAGAYRVFVPAVRVDSSGTSWGGGSPTGSSRPISDFFVAAPSDTARTLNGALAKGMSLLLTPGVYHLDRPLVVGRKGTQVIGLGFPTLIPDKGTAAITVTAPSGAILAGLMVDAGPVSSPALMTVGVPPSGKGSKSGTQGPAGDASDPTTLSDVFFRIGGATPGKAATTLVVNADDVLLDDVWAWRADHGNGVGWTSNTADTGVVVNGSDVTAYGLFVEHYQKTEVAWNGNRGRTIFFQNEMPYDAPDQGSWQHDGVDGYAAYRVGSAVTSHEAWGLGSYSNFLNAGVSATRAFEVPDASGVAMHDLVTVFLNGYGGIDHVINDTGAAVNSSNQVTNVVSYP